MKLIFLLTYSFFILSCSSLSEFNTETSKSIDIGKSKPELKAKSDLNKNTETEIWTGESGNYKIRWTNKDIYLEKNNKSIKLFTTIAKEYFEKNWKYKISYDSGKPVRTNQLNVECPVTLNSRIISIFGNYLTIEIESSVYCEKAAHLSDFSQWLVIDLDNFSQPTFINNSDNLEYEIKREVSLLDIYSDKEIMTALLENEEIKWVFKETNLNPKFNATNELIEWFNKMSEDARNRKHDYGWDTFQLDKPRLGSLTKRSLNDFAFDKIKDDKVLVNLALEPNYRQGDVSSIQLKLNIPAKFRNTTLSNSQQRQIFLKNNSITEYASIDFDNKR